ncbi:sulfonate ABC transporter substrate-binding protein [Halomonas heilongjiangensis]|uniref:Sulfonate ABC transporter substrate-binding protein n=1 Tax=Halomonas heilongjiangensis TaxID=1387883 RepID=A0A2N7TIW0_9GAMM|nr:sulfonate ABC transporter substrate-binding protein [Halomonas heilongjiangensis]PXX92150.1 sulfonate ABC transporter substrate-binding protein [Halomonas heilongjiangensis]
MKHGKNRLASCLAGSLILVSGGVVADTIRIGIGHQSMVTNTVSGGIVLEKLGLIEKYLPTDGDYADAEYEIIFRDYDSGPPITNQMLAGNLEFGVMGDYPLIVNGARFQETGRHQTRLVAITGYNLQGTGNGIVVPVSSSVHSLAELAGQRISTPVGSAAWGMTLKALRDAGLEGQISIVDQSPPVGVANIAGNRIDAHADFGPWSEVMEFRGTGRKIYDGSEAQVPTFHGMVVREAYAEQYPEVVEAVLQATLEAQAWIVEDPMRAAVELAEWTGMAKEVLYLYLSEGGITTQDATIKPAWVEALEYDHQLLQDEMNIPDLDFASWVDDQYVRNAYEARGLDYAAALDTMVTPVASDPELSPAQIWYADAGVVEFDSLADMVAAYREASADGREIYACYVYDHLTGMKMFGKAAFLAESDDGDMAAFMKLADSEVFADEHGGRVVALSEQVEEAIAMAN